MSQIYFIRHGQASAGEANYDKLSTKGEEQSSILGQFLSSKGIQFDKIFTGPLERQVNTCAIAGSHFESIHFPKPMILDGLKEHHGFRAMKKVLPDLVNTNLQVKYWVDEMNDKPELAHKNGMRIFKLFMEGWTSGKIMVPEVQTWIDFRTEVKKALHLLLDEVKKGENAAVFTSGGTISAIMAEALSIKDDTKIASLNYSLKNTSISNFFYSANEFNLGSFNETPHLPEEMITFV
ncbi:MAG: broad specificity phosphatase PhoE [Limisphaerales bacterium]|jgi:broad specificity phosphatase PhoE